MIRKYNYTKRKKITHDRIRITLLNTEPLSFTIDLINLDGLELNGDWKLYLEAYYNSSKLRYDCGTINNNEINTARSLEGIGRSFNDDSNVLFRLLVVDDDSKMIMAIAKKLRPNKFDSNSNKSIFHVDWNQDLSQELYKVTFEQDYPVLMINSKVKNGRSLFESNPYLKMIILSTAVRIVALKIIETKDAIDEGSWQDEWLSYIEKVLSVSCKEVRDGTTDEYLEWVDLVVSKFCRKYRVLDRFNDDIKSLFS